MYQIQLQPLFHYYSSLTKSWLLEESHHSAQFKKGDTTTKEALISSNHWKAAESFQRNSFSFVGVSPIEKGSLLWGLSPIMVNCYIYSLAITLNLVSFERRWLRQKRETIFEKHNNFLPHALEVFEILVLCFWPSRLNYRVHWALMASFQRAQLILWFVMQQLGLDLSRIFHNFEPRVLRV